MTFDKSKQNIELFLENLTRANKTLSFFDFKEEQVEFAFLTLAKSTQSKKISSTI